MLNVSKEILDATTNPFRYKDARKFTTITKFIGKGSDCSSTEAYRKKLKSIANTGEYSDQDIVGVSVNGARAGRVKIDEDELLKAIQAKATIITDKRADRVRKFNIGEREVAEILRNNGYKEQGSSGVWIP
jgi:cupin superfamily acireductone dioxygenase involved in methionine salvage